MKHKRKRLVTNRPVQYGLVVRMMFQWAYLLVVVVVTLPLVRTIGLGDVSTPISQRLQEAVTEGLVLVVVFLLLVPYFTYDSFKLTNRFAGPIYRLQQTFRSQAQGEPFRPIKFRDGDYWQDVADDFNAMMARLNSCDAEPPQAEENDAELSLVETT